MRILFSIISIFAFAQISFADDVCVMNALPNGPLAQSISHQVQEGCSSLTIQASDDSEAKDEKKALLSCCHDSNEFLKNNALPSDSAPAKAILKYRLDLLISVCGKINSGKLPYESGQCFDRMAPIIPGNEMTDLFNLCSVKESKTTDHEESCEYSLSGHTQVDFGKAIVDGNQDYSDCEQSAIRHLFKKL
jgi:hypothetical protein